MTRSLPPAVQLAASARRHGARRRARVGATIAAALTLSTGALALSGATTTIAADDFPEDRTGADFPEDPTGADFPEDPTGEDFPEDPTGEDFPEDPTGESFPEVRTGEEARRTVSASLDPAGLEPAVRQQPEVAQSSTQEAPAFDVRRDINAVVAIVNQERVSAGLRPVSYHPLLEVAARTHADDQRNRPCLIGFVTHTGTDGSNAGDRILRTGLNISRWGENIACAHRSPQRVMADWMASPGHRANIMSPHFTHLGVWISPSDTGQLYWVQNFATLR